MTQKEVILLAGDLKFSIKIQQTTKTASRIDLSIPKQLFLYFQGHKIEVENTIFPPLSDLLKKQEFIVTDHMLAQDSKQQTLFLILTGNIALLLGDSEARVALDLTNCHTKTHAQMAKPCATTLISGSKVGLFKNNLYVFVGIFFIFYFRIFFS